MQFQPTQDLYPRLFAEIFLYLKQYQPPHSWQAVVIYPSRAVDPGDHPHYATLLHSAQVHWIYLEAWVKSPQTFSQRLIHLLLADPQHSRREFRGY